MVKERKTRKKINRFLLMGLAVLVIFILALAVFNKDRLINLVHKKDTPVPSQQASQPTPEATVNYSAPTSDEKNDTTINSAKTNDTPTITPSPSSSAISLIITGAGQDKSNKSIYVGTMIQGATAGTCTLQLLQDNLTVYTAQVSVIKQNNMYTCNGFLVGISNIPSAGNLEAKITVNDGPKAAAGSLIINNVIK